MKENEREVLNAAVMAGRILLESGAEIFRVEDTMGRMIKKYGIESSSSVVFSNALFITSGNEKEKYFAKVMHIPISASRLDKVAAINQLSREIEANGYPISEVKEKLYEIQNMPQKPEIFRILASGIGSGCFCYLFAGNLADCLAAFLAGCILYAYIIFISNRYLSKMVANITGSALVTFLAILLYHFFVGDHLNQMVIGSIIPLLPGVSFTNSIREFAEGDYISGSVRLLDALLVIFSIAIGVGLVFSIYNRLTGGGML